MKILVNADLPAVSVDSELKYDFNYYQKIQVDTSSKFGLLMRPQTLDALKFEI
jgi:hypothetical protein